MFAWPALLLPILATDRASWLPDAMSGATAESIETYGAFPASAPAFGPPAPSRSADAETPLGGAARGRSVHIDGRVLRPRNPGQSCNMRPRRASILTKLHLPLTRREAMAKKLKKRGPGKPLDARMERLLARRLLTWLTRGVEVIGAKGPLTDDAGKPVYRPVGAREVVCVLKFLAVHRRRHGRFGTDSGAEMMEKRIEELKADGSWLKPLPGFKFPGVAGEGASA